MQNAPIYSSFCDCTHKNVDDFIIINKKVVFSSK